MKQLARLFEAHLKMTMRDKGVWFWAIAYPALLMVIFILIFGGVAGDEDAFRAKVAVVREGDGPAADAFERMLRQIPVLEWAADGARDRQEAERLLLDGELDAFIVLPDGETSKTAELYVHKERERSAVTQALSGMLREAVARFEAGAAPEWTVAVRSVSEGGDSLTVTDFIVTGMIALAICQSGLFGMSGLVEMRRNGLLKRLRMTPVRMSLFGAGDILTRFILSAVQLVLLAGIGALLFGVSYRIAPLAFTLLVVIGILSFSAMGYLIASLSRTMESYMAIANIASFLMLFLSGVMIELSMLPDWLQPVSKVLPLTYFVDGIRDTMLYGSGVANRALWLNLAVLSAWMLASFAAGAKGYRWKPETAR